MKLLFVSLLLSALSFANSLEVGVSLSPAGTFVAKSDQVTLEGEFKVSSNGFKAKNITVMIDSLKTGIELRDDHMKNKYFEMNRFPKAILKEGEGSNGKFKGKLEVHGVVRDINGDYEASGKTLDAKFKCKLSDFKISEPKYMGVGVEDEVKVSVQIQGQ